MWLLPALSRISTTAVGMYYDFDVAGRRVPRTGPVLLVANHPNSMVDPGAVAAAARRPVRFLAKAPLFDSVAIGWLVRGAGAIPVYRSEDDPAGSSRNVKMFSAAHRALANGSVVGIFPEGWSHSEPSLTPLKTGAARIALGAAELLGHSFPVVPIGLTFRDKVRFRSDALALVGRPIAWDDLAGRTPTNAAAVRELTARIEQGLRKVTVNLERWEDRPLVEAAEEIYAAELSPRRDPELQLRRRRAMSEVLYRLRRSRPEEVEPLGREILRHKQVLDMLALRATDLDRVPGLKHALWWAVRRGLFFGVAAPLAALGIAVFWIPYKITELLEWRYRPAYDVQASFRVLGGAFFFMVWIALFVTLAWWQWGWIPGLALLIGLPAVGVISLSVRERWTEAWTNARRYFLMRGREDVRRRLRRRQRELARRLEQLRKRPGLTGVRDQEADPGRASDREASRPVSREEERREGQSR